MSPLSPSCLFRLGSRLHEADCLCLATLGNVDLAVLLPLRTNFFAHSHKRQRDPRSKPEIHVRYLPRKDTRMMVSCQHRAHISCDDRSVRVRFLLMMISIRKGNLIDEKADLLAVNRFSDGKGGGAYAAMNERLGGLLDTVAKEESFKSEIGTTLLVRLAGEISAKRVLVVGLGDRKKFCEETVRVAAAATLNAAKAIGAKSVVSVLHGAGGGGLDARTCGKAMAEGIRLADYEFGRYKNTGSKSGGAGSGSAGKSPTSFCILTTDGKKARSAA